MAKLHPLNQRIETAAQLVVRTKIFYDVWWFFEGRNTRPRFLDTMNRYPEFFRFAPHAHFVAFVIQLGALLETDDKSINLKALVKEHLASSPPGAGDSSHLDGLLADLDPIVSKVMILRNNLFAHRSGSLSYAEAFEKAAVVPNTLAQALQTMLQIANGLLASRGLREVAFNDVVVAHAAKMLESLAVPV